jgi:hypothetical protein
MMAGEYPIMFIRLVKTGSLCGDTFRHDGEEAKLRVLVLVGHGWTRVDSGREERGKMEPETSAASISSTHAFSSLHGGPAQVATRARETSPSSSRTISSMSGRSQ